MRLLDWIGIGDVPQKKSLRWHGSAGCTAVLALDNLAKLLYVNHMAANINECADDGAHHIAQESVGSDCEHPLLALTAPLGECDAAIIGGNVGVKLAETREVGVAEQFCGGLVHEREIEIEMALPA